MNPRPDRAPVWAIWLLIAFGAVQPLIWTLPAELTRRPLVLVPILVCWVTLLVLAAIATRRITWLWRTLSQKDRAHRATLNDVQQLQTQNAMLETIARSVDVPLAFQELASRIAQLVPCDRVGLALLSEGGSEFQTYTARAEMARLIASAGVVVPDSHTNVTTALGPAPRVAPIQVRTARARDPSTDVLNASSASVTSTEAEGRAGALMRAMSSGE